MPDLIWEDLYSVGVERMDADHQRLLDLINRAHCAYADDCGPDTSAVIKEMRLYAERHFALEERLMSERDYPEATAHCVEHDHFRTKTMLLEELNDKGGPDPLGLFHFLSLWLINHIMNADRKLGQFLNERGVN